MTIKKKPYQRVNRTSGEVEEKNFQQLILLVGEGKDAEKVAVAADGGLVEQLHVADVKPGDYIKCVNLGKKSIGEGRTMNLWDIYVSN